MVLVLLEGIRRGGRGGKMPTDLNQTQVNQMPGDGDITVFLPHSHVSQKGSAERVPLWHSEMGTNILQAPARNAGSCYSP